ncbi:MAG: hypothetical protein WAW80_04105 [Candidatus Saccharimonadales bacterium]
MSEENIFDERQQNIYDALYHRNVVVAGSYKAAIRAFITPAHQGEERARVSNIGNAIREVMITLPSIMNGSNEPRSKEAEKLLRDLPGKLAQIPELDLFQDQDLIGIPREAAQIFADLAAAASQETKSFRENTAALLAEGSSGDHPAIKQWIGANEFFVKCTHLGRPPEDVNDGMSDEKIEENLRIVEDLIETKITGFFDTRDSLESLLEDINGESR